MMGSGKSSVGKLLSEKYEKNFIDLDQEIEKFSGRSISEIFAHQGQADFRHMEKTMLVKFAAAANAVIATGGGLILERENRELMADTGITVYLKTTLETLVLRLSNTGKRPLLAGDNLEGKLKDIMLVREKLYEESAQFTIETNSQAPGEIVKKITAHLR